MSCSRPTTSAKAKRPAIRWLRLRHDNRQRFEHKLPGAVVRQAFMKDDSVGKLVRLNYRPRAGPLRKLRIKLEVDTHPPSGASYAMPVLDYPFPEDG